MTKVQKQVAGKMKALVCPPEGIQITGGKQNKKGNQYPNIKNIDLEKHVDGTATYALDVTYKDASDMKTCKWGVIDVDENGAEGLDRARAIREHLESQGIHTAMSFSGNKGFHVYVFTEPVPEEIMKKSLKKVKASFSFKGEAIPGDGFRCKPAPCLHQAAGNVSYLFRNEPYPENFTMDNLPKGFYKAQLAILKEVTPTPANVMVLYAASELKAEDHGDIEHMTPDFGPDDSYVPPCITKLVDNGGSASLGTWDKNNLTLAGFCTSRGMSSDKALELAKTIAKNADSGPVETTKTYNDKVRHFKSIQNTPAVMDNPFNCTYLLKAKAELLFDCGKCQVKPKGVKTTPFTAPSGRFEELTLEISIANDLIAWFIQKGGPSGDVIPEIMPAVEYKSQVNPFRQVKIFVYSVILTAFNEGADSEASLAKWLDYNGSTEEQFRAFFSHPFVEEYKYKGEDHQRHFFAELKNKILKRFRELKTCELVDEDTFQENLDRALDRSMRYRIIKQSGTLEKDSYDFTKDIHTTSVDCTHEVGKILSVSQQGQVMTVEAKAEALLEYIIGGGAARVPTPFPVLNDLLGGGFANGTQTTLVGMPGGGKSTVSAQFADYAAGLGIPAVFVSMEMSEEQIFVNSIARAGCINSSKIMSPYADIKNTVMDQVADLAETYFDTIGKYLYVVEGSYNTSPARIATMVSKVRADLKMSKKEPFLVVIDYLQLLNTGIEAMDIGPNETQKISELAVKIKQLARDCNVAVVALSDVTKEEQKNSNESKELTLNSPRGSNRIGHAADTVIALYSESAQADGGKAKTDPWDMYIKKVSTSESAQDFIENIKETKDSANLGGDGATVVARMELIKNRAGQGRGSQFMLYHRAYHKFDPLKLEGQEKAEGRA